MRKRVLLIAALDGAENCARVLEEQIDAAVELVENRVSALEAVRNGSYALIMIDEHLVEGDAAWADRIWAGAGVAVPLQINLALSGCARLVREAKAALTRRISEQEIARRAAMLDIQKDLSATVTGLLLESELALRVDAVPPELEPRLRHMVQLAADLRERLRLSQEPVAFNRT